MEKRTVQSKFLNKRKLLATLTAVLMMIVVYWNCKLLPIERHWFTRADLPEACTFSPSHSLKYKVILYWNTFFGDAGMSFGLGNKIFENCSYKNCFATSNKSFLPMEQFDSIVFHAPRYTVHQDGYPFKRCAHQKYIFYSMESPFNVKIDRATKEYFYNWTMTYRTDSDIHRPYSIVVKSDENYTIPTVEEIKKKSKKIAWFVSNCQTAGSHRRMNYAQELNKYIPVDIYGTCGTLTCENRTACYKMLETDYKFYLSFENSMCKDYVTEKLFNVLEYNVVPIVLDIFSYNGIAPPYSVISTERFPNPKELANYLFRLDRNPREYLKYFMWKKYYKVANAYKYTLCQLCERLNKPVKYFSYKNVEEWFYGFNCVL